MVTQLLIWPFSTFSLPLTLVGCYGYVTLTFVYLYAQYNVVPNGLGGGGGERVEGCPSEDDIMRMYAAMTRKPHPLPHWTFFLALSCFRMASIAQVSSSILCTCTCTYIDWVTPLIKK